MSDLPVNQIVEGDYQQVMSEWPEKSIDLIFTDPPYGLKDLAVITREGGKFGKAKAIHKNLVSNPESIRGVDYKEWISIVVPKLKKNGILITFCLKQNISYIQGFLEDQGMTVRHIGAWVKSNPPPQARKVKWMNGWEPFIIATVNKGAGHHYNYKEGQHRDVIETPICMGNERTEHPTQKPVKLAEPIIKWWSFEGDLIVDPFCGAGTFPLVAYKLNRRFIGIEINHNYVEMAKERISTKCSRKLEEFV